MTRTIHGRFRTDPADGPLLLDFRVTIDPSRAGASARYFDAISGDVFYQEPARKKQLLFSFMLDNGVQIAVSNQGVTVSGQVEVYRGKPHPASPVRPDDDNPEIWVQANFPIDFEQGITDVTVSSVSGIWANFSLRYENAVFRKLRITAAFVDQAPSDPFPSVARFPEGKLLTLASVFAEEDADIDFDPEPRLHTVVPPNQDGWTHEALNGLLATIFSESSQPEYWPQEQAYGLVVDRLAPGCAGGHEETIAGVCFDDVEPGNQAFAIFSAHPHLAPPPEAVTDAEKNLFFIWVHETGHLLGLGHTSDVASWMCAQKGGQDFKPWGAYRGGFTPFEKMLLRHQRFLMATPGGRIDPTVSFWRESDWVFSPTSVIQEGKKRPATSSVELRLFAKSTFALLEPVEVEIRLRNVSDTPIQVSSFLDAQDGFVQFRIRRARNSTWEEFHPYRCYLRTGGFVELLPGDAENAAAGLDRLSKLVGLSMGYNGISSLSPGTYEVQARYDDGTLQLISEPIKIVVGAYEQELRPFIKAVDPRVLWTFLHDNGTLAYRDNTALRTLVDATIKRHTQARVKLRYREAITRYYGSRHREFQLRNGQKSLETLLTAADDCAAVRFFAEALSYYQTTPEIDPRRENFTYRRQAEMHARHLANSRQPEVAQALIDRLATDLSARGVKPARIRELQNSWNLACK